MGVRGSLWNRRGRRPVLELWEDWCLPAAPRRSRRGHRQATETGIARVIWRPTAFLDRNLGNDASNRAIGA